MLNTLEIINLSYQRQQKQIFAGLSFKLCSGDLLVIQGPNGAGKSTLLRTLAGLATPDTGSIQCNEKNIQHMHPPYSQMLHYLGHHNGLKLSLTVNENIAFFSHLMGVKFLNQHIENILSQLNLLDKAKVAVRHLSAGQKRRLALAKLMLFPKYIWILDEPLTSLDTLTQDLFVLWLSTHLENAGICLLSSHQPFLHGAATFLRLD